MFARCLVFCHTRCARCAPKDPARGISDVCVTDLLPQESTPIPQSTLDPDLLALSILAVFATIVGIEAIANHGDICNFQLDLCP